MAITEDGRPICGGCGTTPRTRITPATRGAEGDNRSSPPWDTRPYTATEYEQAARAGGWRIGLLPGNRHDAMCPTCARPDRALVRLCKELAASIELEAM
jgi:hypothetical protein